ncbi:MAG: hypothetical protein JO257_11730 [Deltaproteobacteria bacterium]|nr:hypothetical protein [Deltaproteobacteria bacterium]
MNISRVLVVIAALAACKGKDATKVTDKAAPNGTATGLAATAPGKGDVALVDHAQPKIDGPSVTPVVTGSITFVVPKDATWWGEMTFACYAAAINLQPGQSVATPFTQLSPTVAPAMSAAGIDLEHDIAAVGAWGTADEPSFYIALNFQHPDRLKTMLEQLAPGAPLKEISKTHYVLSTAGVAGNREIHVILAPIAWPAKVPGDKWSTEAAKATHIVFFGGLFGKGTSVDPLAQLSDAASAPARVKDTEAVLTDARGRCVTGFVNKTDFQPGYKLDHARFGFAGPEGAGDPLTNLLGSHRTLELAVELTLSPAPTDATVQGWIDQAKQWVRATVEPIKMQFAGQGPAVDVLFDLAGLLGNKGFKYTLKDKVLTLTWRTDRIPASDLTTYEKRLEAVLPGGFNP